MKTKMLLIPILIMFICGNIIAQEPVAEQGQKAGIEQTFIEAAPKSRVMLTLDGEYDRKRFNKAIAMLDKVENHYISKIKKLYNDEIEYMRKYKIDLILHGKDPKYYPVLKNKFKNYVSRAMIIIKQMWALIKDLEGSMKYIISEKENNDIFRRAYFSTGLLYFFSTENGGLKKAIDNLEIALTYVSEEEKERRFLIHSLLASAYNYIIPEYRKVYHVVETQREIYHLYSMTVIQNEGNEALKEYKIIELLKQYKNRISVGTEEYRLYKPYIDKITAEDRRKERETLHIKDYGTDAGTTTTPAPVKTTPAPTGGTTTPSPSTGVTPGSGQN